MKKLEKAPFVRSFAIPDIVDTLSKDDMIALLNKINEEYYYWDKVKYQPLPDKITHETLWRLIKLRRMNTPYTIVFGKYNFYWNLNSRLHSILHFLDMNIGGSLESSSIISKTDKNSYLISSLMEEAIASSQIEGAVTTRKHAKEMLRKNVRPSNLSEQMIFNNYDTIQKIIEIKSERLTLKNFLEVHKWVTNNTLSNRNEEGALRRGNDIHVVDMTDGSIVHRPPETEELSALLDDLFLFFNEDNPEVFIHPIIKACIIHFIVGYIHPFSDGNGRTARALFYWYLLKKEYWLTEYLSISRLILKSKAQYARAFQYTEIDDNDMTYFIAYKLKTMRSAFEELRDYIKRKNEEKRTISSFLGIEGISYRQALILEWFNSDPDLLITVKEVEARIGVSNMTARNDLNDLLKKEFLEVRKINNVTRGYIRGKQTASEWKKIGRTTKPKD